MKVICIENNISAVDEKLREFAFNQDENGDIDISIGKEYSVYGVQKSPLGVFYLVLTDDLNNDLPWWMPSQLYEVTDKSRPNGWIEKQKESDYGGDLTVYSYPIYFEAEEDIEDGTEKGYEVFAKMMSEQKDT